MTNPSGRAVICTGAIALVAWGANFFLFNLFSNENAGLFGDSFGVVNSLFSGMAFIGVVYSVSLQREELRISRVEINRTKEIMDKQEENIKFQFIQQSRASQELTFFRLFEKFGDVTNTIDLVQKRSGGSVEFKGKDAFKIFFDRLCVKFKPPYSDYQSPDIEEFKRKYIEFFKDNGYEIAHYLRMIYTVLKFVDSMDGEDKYFYAKLMRSNLSNFEANLLFCNYLSEQTTKEFNVLVNKYGFLKNVDHEHDLIKSLRHHVDPRAFGRAYTESS